MSGVVNVLSVQRQVRSGGAGGAAEHYTDHYGLLELSIDHSLAELRASYKRLSRRTHPDRRGGSAESFAAVAAAHEVLRDAKRRTSYDDGDDLERGLTSDGSEGLLLSAEIERQVKLSACFCLVTLGLFLPRHSLPVSASLLSACFCLVRSTPQ